MSVANKSIVQQINEISTAIKNIDITTFNKPSLFKNAEDILSNTIIGIILWVTRNDPEWQKNYILREDVKEYRKKIKEKDSKVTKNDHPRFCVLPADQIEKMFNIKYGEQIDETKIDEVPHVDLGMFDFAALTKLLRHRINRNNENKIIGNFAIKCYYFRTDKSHETKNSSALNDKKSLEFIKDVPDLLDGIFKSLEENKSEVEKLFEISKQKLEIVYERLDGIINPNEIDPDSRKELTPKDLCSYRIIVDEFALSNIYGSSFIGKLEKFVPEIMVSDISVRNLFKIRSNPELRGGEVSFLAKQAYDKVLDGLGKFTRIPLKPEHSLKDADDSAEHIMLFAKEYSERSPEKKLCIITVGNGVGDYLAEEIYNIGNRNIVAVKAIRNGVVVPFGNKGITRVSFESDSCEFKKEKTSEENSAVAKAETVSGPKTADVSEYRTVSKNFRMPKKDDTVYIRFPYGEVQEIKLTEMMFSGGEGNIYSNNKYGSMLIKIYKPEKLNSLRIKKIEKMVEFSVGLERDFLERICWPEAVVYDTSNSCVIGYAMEDIKEAITIEDLLSNLQNSTTANVFWNKREDLVKICEGIAVRFNELHSVLGGNVLMGDINAKNILVSNDEGRPCVHFIDVDSYQLDENNLCPVGTSDFSSPRIHLELKSGKTYSEIVRDRNDELFAMCVLFFYILSIKEFPFDVNEKLKISESIIKGQYAYYNHQEGEAGSKKPRRNNIYQNFSEHVKNLFVEVFKNKNYNFSDLGCKNCFSYMLNDIREGKLSNEIFPNCALQFEDDRFVKVKCQEADCGFVFESSVFDILCRNCKQKSKKAGKIVICKTCSKTIEEYDNIGKPVEGKVRCQHCKVISTCQKSEIGKITCSNCGYVFTANMFDLTRDKIDFEKPLCPDCNPNFFFSKHNEMYEDLEAKLSENLSYAVKNFKRWRNDNESQHN